MRHQIKVNKDGYFHCEGCNHKSKKIYHLVYFKGKFLCNHCKVNASKSNCFIPTSTPTDSTLQNLTRLPEGRRMPREHWKGQTRMSEDMREALLKKTKEESDDLVSDSDEVFWVGLNARERQILWRHFYKQGFSEEQIKIEINKIQEQIKKAHLEHKQGIIEKAPTFKEHFEELING